MDAESIDTQQYIELNAKGSLWITLQYIENGLLDEVEADVRTDVTHRDAFGPFAQNTAATLVFLTDRAEHDRVFRVYRAAIAHRLRALTGEARIRDRSSVRQSARTKSATWISHYLPAARQMVQEYQALLVRTARSDPEIEAFQQSLQAIEHP